ncbi:MAG: hypothetical protein NT069_28615 [Planctomycetota bacterium]|nr:hypothetical protein [Planctomycetota bacterium]
MAGKLKQSGPTPQKIAERQILEGTAPPGLRVPGVLDLATIEYEDPAALRRGVRRKVISVPDEALLRQRELRSLPERLHADALILRGRTELAQLPAGLRAYELLLNESGVRTLPADLQVELRIDLTGCELLESLPAGLSVGSLILSRCTGLMALPERLDVWSLDLTGCWAFDGWPKQAQIRSGRLQLRGCTALRSLPGYLRKLAAVNVRDCPNLTSLPAGLEITGWLDLAHSGLTTEESLPESLESVQIRWAGVPIDRRIAFHPETIEVAEVLAEKNAEVRRVLLDRYGYSKFLIDARADVVDRDTDPGGERQLFRLAMEGDEDLVAMSCYCPSTGRQYIIRVPPTTLTCRHAAAWIAGYDNPDDYNPLIET